jgi:outer membrane immunogenic protein
MRTVLTAAAIGVLTNTALAADIYEQPAPIADIAPMGSDWSGFHVGLHGGYGWADLQSLDEDDLFDEADLGGPVLGGQIGFNKQWDWAVLGAEADASWSGIDHDEDEDWGVDWLASARLRAGVALDACLSTGQAA